MVRLIRCLMVLGMCACGVGAQVRSGTGPVVVDSVLSRQIDALLADPAVARAHWGIKVTAMDGSPIYSLNEGQLFQPASNAKLFTTAAAMALLGAGTTFETKVVAKGSFDGAEKLSGDLVLIGGGDANLSGREIPYVAPAFRPKPVPPAAPALRYLEEMADQIAKTGLKVVTGDVVGDDTLFPWEPYAEDWAIDDAVWGYGAPVSALSITDNQLKVTVTPGATMGSLATLSFDPDVPYYTVEHGYGVSTGSLSKGSKISVTRALGSKVLRITGQMAIDSPPDVEEISIQDPAEYAALALKGMLALRGIEVKGVARARHWAWFGDSDFVEESRRPPEKFIEPTVCLSNCTHGIPPIRLAWHVSPPVREDVVLTNKVSQNLHAEILLHHLGALDRQDGSTLQGARVVRQFLLNAGIDKDDFVFFDGSGLSGHDLVTPRATVRLLQYASTQPWFADWKRSLPVGGEDGSLMERFAKAPLKDHVFAKTGTLGEARALSGYLDGASGQTVIFSIMVGNHMPHSNVDRDVMDKIVAAIAAAN